VVIEEATNDVFAQRRHPQACATNPSSKVRRGTDVLLDDLDSVTTALEVRGEIVEADAEVAPPEALEDAVIGEKPIQRGGSFPAARGLSGASMIMRTSGDRPTSYITFEPR
jgi:hypothetical protein